MSDGKILMTAFHYMDAHGNSFSVSLNIEVSAVACLDLSLSTALIIIMGSTALVQKKSKNLLSVVSSSVPLIE